jgi:hypothetical protein
MPQGSFEFFASGLAAGGSGALRLSLDSLRIIRSRVETDALGNPHLDVLGEMTNPLPVDLSGVFASAYVSRALDSRNEEVPLGCRGILGASDTVPVRFGIPLTNTMASEPIVFEHVSAIVGGGSFVTVPASDVRYERNHVVSTLFNPIDQQLNVRGVCVTVRRGGDVVDAYTYMAGPLIAAGATVEWQSFQQIPEVPGATIEIVAYGEPCPSCAISPPDY